MSGRGGAGGGGGRGRGRGRGRGGSSAKFAHVPGADMFATGEVKAPELFPPINIDPPVDPTEDEEDIYEIGVALLDQMQVLPYFLHAPEATPGTGSVLPTVERYSDRLKAKKTEQSRQQPLSSLNLDPEFFPEELQSVVDLGRRPRKLRSTGRAGTVRTLDELFAGAEGDLDIDGIDEDGEGDGDEAGGEGKQRRRTNADGTAADDTLGGIGQEEEPGDFEDDDDDGDYDAEQYFDDDRDELVDGGGGGGGGGDSDGGA